MAVVERLRLFKLVAIICTMKIHLLQLSLWIGAAYSHSSRSLTNQITNIVYFNYIQDHRTVRTASPLSCFYLTCVV